MSSSNQTRCRARFCSQCSGMTSMMSWESNLPQCHCPERPGERQCDNIVTTQLPARRGNWSRQHTVPFCNVHIGRWLELFIERLEHDVERNIKHPGMSLEEKIQKVTETHHMIEEQRIYDQETLQIFKEWYRNLQDVED